MIPAAMTFTMKTKAIPLLSLSILIFLTTSHANPINSSPTNSSLPNNMETPTNGTEIPSGTKPAMEMLTKPKDTSTASLSPMSTSVNVTTHILKTSPLTPLTPATTPNPPALPTRLWLVAILLVIVALAVFVGFVHCLWARRTNGSAPRILLDMRERLRSGIGNLEDRLGVQLWPEEKSAGEEEEEDVEEARSDKEEGSCDEGPLTNVKEKEEHEEEDSETSSEDNSSMEEDDPRETALNTQSKEKNQNQTKQNTSGGQSAAGGENSQDSKEPHGDSSKQGHENTDLFNVTAL